MNRKSIKKQIKETGHSVADLCRSADGEIPYLRLNGYLNGYWLLRPEQNKTIQKIVGQWVKELSISRRVGG